MADDSTVGGSRRLRQVLSRESDGSDDQLRNPWIAGAAVLLLLLLPLLPFLAVVWTIGRTLRGVRKRVAWE